MCRDDSRGSKYGEKAFSARLLSCNKSAYLFTQRFSLNFSVQLRFFLQLHPYHRLPASGKKSGYTGFAASTGSSQRCLSSFSSLVLYDEAHCKHHDERHGKNELYRKEGFESMNHFGFLRDEIFPVSDMLFELNFA